MDINKEYLVYLYKKMVKLYHLKMRDLWIKGKLG
jgi:hypothetical protein